MNKSLVSRSWYSENSNPIIFVPSKFQDSRDLTIVGVKIRKIKLSIWQLSYMKNFTGSSYYYETRAFADDLDVFVNTEYKNAVLEQK
jgi:hypothetical protein